MSHGTKSLRTSTTDLTVMDTNNNVTTRAFVMYAFV